MKNQKLYKIVIKAMKEIDSEDKSSSCDNCISHFIKAELNKLDFYDYKGYHKDSCSDPLFYLEDLGIIKIISGGNRISGVECGNLRIKILNSCGNKI